MADWDLQDTILRLLGLFALFLIVFGTLSSVLNIVVCLRKRLRRVNTFVCLLFISLADIFTLYCWNFDRFINIWFPSQRYETLSLGFCKFIVFLQFFSLDWSSWLLVLLNIDRYLSIKTKSWKSKLFRPSIAAVYCILIGVVMALINVYIIVANGFESTNIVLRNVSTVDTGTGSISYKLANVTTVNVACYRHPYYLVYPFWKIVSFPPLILKLYF